MGTLYIVSTPIGNIDDITIRAIKVLASVDIIASENVSATKLLLALLKTRYGEYFTSGRTEKIISANEFEEEFKLPEIVRLIEEGNKVAYVSQAGTPLISDPGFKLVREALKRNIEVTSIPGVSSPITALSISGLPTDTFLFIGFLPKSKQKSLQKLNTIKKTLEVGQESKISPTVILFESPHRLFETLENLQSVFGDIDLVIARELTKKYEEVERQTISGFIEKYTQKVPRGEFVLLFTLKD